MHFCRISQNWFLKVDLATLFRDKHGHLFLWYLDLFYPSFNVGQTKIENMHFCRLSQNWKYKVDLDTHFRDKHGDLFLWDLELFCLSFKVGQTIVENMHFCRLSRNRVLKVYLGTHLRDKHVTLFMRFGAILALVQGWSNKGWKYALFSTFSELSFKSGFRYPFER